MKPPSLLYLASALHEPEFPRCLDPRGNPLPEIALAGRSNVGKSTLINLLGHQKALAKVSSIPGKTQRIQFFAADDKWIIADLPGYGYAKAPAKLQAEWSAAIHEYLSTRASLKLLLLLLDIRREPSPEDLELAAWAAHRSLPLLPVFTKTDMISPRESERLRQSHCSQLAYTQNREVCVPCPRHILWSAIAAALGTAYE